jgi:hypothetical protein
MTPQSRDWLSGLREFAAAERLKKPPAPPGDEQSPSWAAQRAVLAAHLATWLDAELEPILESRRRFAAALPAADPDAAIVLTTSPAGIAAAEDVLGRRDPLLEPLLAERRRSIAVVREVEYRLWCIRHPDPDHLRHFNHWSWIKTDVPRQRWGEFARFPVADHETYWLHRTGTGGAGTADARACHLWKWNGATAALLRPFFAESIAAI